MKIDGLTVEECKEVESVLHSHLSFETYDKIFNSKSESTYIVSMKTYLKLKAESMFLQCLKDGGVDNWDGWEYACDAYDEMK